MILGATRGDTIGSASADTIGAMAIGGPIGTPIIILVGDIVPHKECAAHCVSFGWMPSCLWYFAMLEYHASWWYSAIGLVAWCLISLGILLRLVVS